MRPRLLLSLLLALFSLSAMAQREYSPNLCIGVKGGATLSSMAFSPEVHQKMVQGLAGGLVVRYHEEKLFGLIGEVNITQRGWSEDFARDEAPQFSYSRRLTYVQVPLMTHIYFGPRRVKFFFNLGPEFGFMIGDRITANFDWKDYGSIEGFPQGYRTNEQLSKEVENRFDYGIAGGAGIEIFVTPRNSLMLEGRYYFGLGNIFHATKRDYFAASRTQSIGITLAYLFRVR